MERRHVIWLHRQLPDLIQRQILTADSAAALRRHYPLPPARTGLGTLIVAILGSLLVGLGIVLLVAHNWDALGRGVRTLISFAPLLFGQGVLAWALARRTDSLAARESGAILATLGVFASVALIGQTYHMYGNLPGYLLACSLLALPLVYLANAALPGTIVSAVLAGWVVMAPFSRAQKPMLWLVLLLVLPWLVLRLRQAQHRWQPLLVLWVWGPALALAVSQGFLRLEAVNVTLTLVLLAGVYLLLDSLWLAAEDSAWKRPLRLCGMVLLVGLMVPMSFDDGFRELSRQSSTARAMPWSALAVQLVLAAGLAGMLVWSGIRRRFSLWAGVAALLALVLFAGRSGSVGGALLVNLLLILLGGLAIRKGLRTERLGTLNGGLLLVAVTIVLRFFDSELPFLFKGLAFILIGGAMIALNLWVRTRRTA